jgi:hypothetical protein
VLSGAAAGPEVLIISGDQIPLQSYDQLTTSIPVLIETAPVQTHRGTLTSKDVTLDAQVWGVTSEMLRMFERAGRLEFDGLAGGRFLSREDQLKNAAHVVLGSMIAERLFPDQSAVGQPVAIDGREFVVVGTLSGTGASEVQDAAFVPFVRGRPMNAIWLYHESDAEPACHAVEESLRQSAPGLKYSIMSAYGNNLEREAPPARAKSTALSSPEAVSTVAEGAISLAIASFFVLVASGVIPLNRKYRNFRWIFWIAAVVTAMVAVVRLFGFVAF